MFCQKGEKRDGQTHWAGLWGVVWSSYSVVNAWGESFHVWVTFWRKEEPFSCWMCCILSHLEFLLPFPDQNQSPSVRNNFQSLGVSSKWNWTSKAIASWSSRMGRCGGRTLPREWLGIKGNRSLTSKGAVGTNQNDSSVISLEWRIKLLLPA